jgi:CPA1 family monovalent cation:H+ antiporter
VNPPDASIHVETLLALLLVASATAVVIKWVRVPYAVALVIAGLIIGLSKVMPPVSMTPELVLLIFLPALLFEASWNMDIEALRRDWLSIGVLATVGVIVCMFAVASILHFVGGMNMQTSLLFGAMVSATDPVSVIALFRQMGIDKRLTMILEGESLFNDGTAVVMFQMMLVLALSGGEFSLANTVGSFCFVVFGGAILGAITGYAASRITSAFDDHLLEITLTMVTAYGSYLLAGYLHVSSIIAVVAAGIVVGNYGSRTGMSTTTRFAVNSFWEYAAFLVNSLLFLLIGLQVQLPLLIKHANVIGLGVLAVFAARLLVVYGICPFVSSKRLPIPGKWRHLMFWGGLRGALVMALALSLPLAFPAREAIINMTFGVVLFTLLVPGLTMEPLVRFLGMAPKEEKPMVTV